KNSKKNTDVNIDEDKVVDQIRQTDPDFNREQFRDYASKILLAVLGAISGRNALSARPYESDNLFSVHEKQIREDIEGQRINHMEDITVIFVKIADYIAKDETDTVTVLAKISLLDYTTDTVKGNLLDGSRLAHRNRSFRLEFIRSHGLKSSADLEADTDCPVCNKPMNITVTGKCGECKTNLCDGSRGWILNSLSKWGRET
ncbi:MAG: TIM44-like domain-containing protein, partial [Eubacteriales bacterium]|nr:TIM44-like domain-containing protein [Eubacteriales bacterium]